MLSKVEMPKVENMTPRRAAARPLTMSLPASEMTSDREKMDRAPVLECTKLDGHRRQIRGDDDQGDQA